MARVSMLGLGAMGSRMAARLVAAGHEVTAWNRTPRAAPAGTGVAPTPSAAVAGAEVAFSMLRDDEASRAVWLDPKRGALASLAPGALAVECSTLTVGWARELSAHVAAAGGVWLDAPVVGSRRQAEAGELIFLAGGEPATFAQAAPLLGTMGAAAHHVGAAGAGAALKLVVNALFAAQVATLAEMLQVLAHCGLDARVAVDAMAATPVLSAAAKGAAGLMLAGTHAPMFPAELVVKDLGYALAVAEGKAPMTEAALTVFAAAAARGWAGDNLTVAHRLYVRTAGEAA